MKTQLLALFWIRSNSCFLIEAVLREQNSLFLEDVQKHSFLWDIGKIHEAFWVN